MTTESNTAAAALSEALADAVATAGTSTVLVNARRRLPASGIAWTADGAIVTANHVIEREEDITVVLPDGKEVAATIAGRDPGSDLAVLRAAGAALTPARRGGALRVGSLVVAVGRPSRGGPQASVGIVSASGGPWRTFSGGQVAGWLRSDTTFFPGFSGGPLVTVAGDVAAINSSRLGRGAGLSIPVAAAAPIVEALLSGGRIKRGYLGIGSQQVRLPAGAGDQTGGQETGLLVVGVEAGTPADQGGMMVGDIVIKIGETVIRDTDDLQAALGPESVGRATPITVLRGGEPRTLAVTVGERA